MKLIKLFVLALGITALLSCNNSSEKKEDAIQVETTVSSNQEIREAVEPGTRPYDLDNLKGSKLILAGSYLSPTDQVNRLTSTKGKDVMIYMVSNGLEMPFRLVSENENNKILQNADISTPWEGRFEPGYIYTIHTGQQPANSENDQFKIQVQIK